MCGICGWIGNQPSDTPKYLGLMINALSKRGPDDWGVWRGSENGKHTVLGHTRLSIIDVDGSAQPMTNEDGNIILTYNGEIYNYRQLRAMLIARGHQFRTKGDAEVLVHLYEECGPDMVRHLDGMFAFGIYDARRHTLLLARDRIGIKPLYYWHNPATGELLFASDMSAILANQTVPRRINLRALAQYLHFGFAVHPLSLLQQVHQVEPGQTLQWEAGTLNHAQYYTWEYKPRVELVNPQTAIAELSRTLHDSVASHLIADVPIGSFLSGGLDSSSITGFAQQIRQQSGDAINSFTVKFWIEEYDESSRARAIARELNTQHTEIEAKELSFDRCFLDKLVDGLGEPFADTSALAVYLLCQQARPYIKVALSGDGGDELFLGYTGFRKQRLARRLRRAPAIARRMGISMTAGRHTTLPRRLNKVLRLSLLDDPTLIMDWLRRWEWDELCKLLGKELFHQLFPSQDLPFPDLYKHMGAAGETTGFLEKQMRFYMRVVLPCNHLFKVDRMSMAHGLEVRVPTLANRMLEYGQQLPLDMRTQKGRTKEPLRTVAERLSSTVAQPSSKRGFEFPLDSWMRGKAAQYWREWNITPILTKIGFQAAELDRLTVSYDRISHKGEDYNSGSLSRKLFDLMLLAIWLDNYEISV